MGFTEPVGWLDDDDGTFFANPKYHPTEIIPLDVSADETFTHWLSLPPNDHRTIEEFAADGDSGTTWREAREDRRALRDELPPTMPDGDE